MISHDTVIGFHNLSALTTAIDIQQLGVFAQLDMGAARNGGRTVATTVDIDKCAAGSHAHGHLNVNICFFYGTIGMVTAKDGVADISLVRFYNDVCRFYITRQTGTLSLASAIE